MHSIRLDAPFSLALRGHFLPMILLLVFSVYSDVLYRIPMVSTMVGMLWTVLRLWIFHVSRIGEI